MSKGRYRIKTEVPASMGQQIKSKKVIDFVRRSSEQQVHLTNPTKFFEAINRPVESKLHTFIEDLKKNSTEMLDVNGVSKIVEIDMNGRWRWATIKTSAELKQKISESEKNHSAFMKMREQSWNRMLKKREDIFGGSGFANEATDTSPVASFPTRQEYSPLIGSPFYKQMYLMDYWEMHSRCFWYKNYSGIAKMVVDMTRNFVMGKVFTVQFEDKKAQQVWSEYEERSNIQEEARAWCDELTTFGENMIRKIPSMGGILHRSIDPSTVWEIVTDPENIKDVKYYHQQYNTQYQLYSTQDAPTTKYILNQIPPQLMLHEKINVTTYEKRGRSDLLAPLLYFKYYEDFMISSLIRAKNEAAFIWDVTIKGSDEDVQAYINNTGSIVDVPPGSENVHNEAITRTPLSPTFGKKSTDETAQNILSYIAMAVSIPTNYFGTFGTGGFTKAGALVATEPVAKKMVERQLKMEFLIRRIVKDVMIDAGLDPSLKFEITFPEIMEEDRTAKIKDLVVAKTEGAISHKTMSTMLAKELKFTKYDYDKEQEEIKAEAQKNSMFDDGMDSDLTSGNGLGDDQKERQFNRASVKDKGLKL